MGRRVLVLGRLLGSGTWKGECLALRSRARAKEIQFIEINSRMEGAQGREVLRCT